MTEKRATRHTDFVSVEHGTNRPRGLTLSISGPWAEDQGPDAEARYVAAITAILQGSTDDIDELTSRIRHHFAQQELALADKSIEHLAEQLHRAVEEHVSVLGADGRVLYGDPDASAARHVPGVHGTEDPANPHRPLLS